MKFIIENKVFEKFPKLIVAVPIIMGFDNTVAKDRSLEFLRTEEENLRKKYNLETFYKDQKVQVYIKAFKDFGVDPEQFLPAHVALSKRIIEGKSLPDINPIVNLYNAMSIKYTTPFGGEDLDTLYGNFVLKFAEGGESWVPIGGNKSKPAQKGELVWGDDYDLSTKALNWRQCDRTKLAPESHNGYFIMDGFDGVNRDVIQSASNEFVELMIKDFGAEGKIYWLDKNTREFEIPFQSKNVAGSNPKPSSVEIVSLTPDLLEAYKEIRLKGLLEDPQAFGRSYEEEVAFPQEKWLERANNPLNFMAMENGVPLGTMGAYLSDEDGKKIANIVGVFVSKEARGRGIGSKLLEAVLDKIKEDPGIKTVKLSVNKEQTPAVKLYEKFGLKTTGEDMHMMGDGNEHAEYNMELNLK